jgi:uncharacterized membrane protein
MFVLFLASIIMAIATVSGGLSILSDNGVLTDLRIIIGFCKLLNVIRVSRCQLRF